MLKIYYNDLMVCTKYMDQSQSKSPTKPLLVLNDLKKILPESLYSIEQFEPYTKEDFYIAHTEEYVNSVYNFNMPGVKLASDIPWSEELVKSLELTNASLYNAIYNSIINPEYIHYSTTSGFHHAKPDTGLGFCTFSGQVIASTKIYRDYGKVGCYLDLDGHFGNSIEDSRLYVKDLNNAIPQWANFNPSGTDKYYTDMLYSFLYNNLSKEILNGNIDYIVWCHGADSHEFDDFGGQVDTEHWQLCCKIFWNWVKYINIKLNKPIPVSCALFGGYRKDDYESVINLHVSDIIEGLNVLYNTNINYNLNYSIPLKYRNLFKK